MSTLGAYFRLARVGWVLVREGVVLALPSDDLPASAQVMKALLKPFARSKAKRAQRSDRLAVAVERLGPSYVKMGQFLATRPDVVGADFADDLASLQDRMAFFPAAAAKANIEGSLGRSVSELYREFGDPIAAASIAQVHPAIVDTPKGPRKVAVKVIRPGVRQRFQNDLEAMYLIADLQQRFVRSARRLRPVEVTRTLEQTTKIEMDLRLEAAALSELAENTKEDPGFRVPEVDWERTGRDVVTMEWIDGVKMSDIEGLKAAGHDLNKLADTLIQSFLRHTLRDGFFHADMHPGNLFVDPQGMIVAVDMGIAGRLGKKERRFLAEILYGFITRDYMRVAEVHFEAGYVPGHHDKASFAQAIRAIGEPIHGQPAETISMGKLLTLLFEVTELFDMETRPELVMLQTDHGGGGRRIPHAQSAFQHVESGRSGRQRLDKGQSWPETHCHRSEGRREGGSQACGSGPRDRCQDGEAAFRPGVYERERPAFRRPDRGSDRQGGSAPHQMGPGGALGDCAHASLYRDQDQLNDIQTRRSRRCGTLSNRKSPVFQFDRCVPCCCNISRIMT
ncbi:ubiquinone biosynthesis protein [Agrobacterium tumefaciens]|nr:ubiquinone biosynthesis protein [Agrobacterium tumefaciens]